MEEEGAVVKVIGDKLIFTHSCNNPVLEKLRYFKDNGLYCDVVLKAKNGNEKQLDAHSCILASGSALFEKVFIGKFMGKTTHYVDNISFEHLSLCVDFIYRKPFEFPYEEIGRVVDAAQMLEIYELEKWCQSVESVVAPAKVNKNVSSNLVVEENSLDSNPEQSIHLEILENPLKFETNTVCDEFLQEDSVIENEIDNTKSALVQAEMVFEEEMDQPDSLSVQGEKIEEIDSIPDMENECVSEETSGFLDKEVTKCELENEQTDLDDYSFSENNTQSSHNVLSVIKSPGNLKDEYFDETQCNVDDDSVKENKDEQLSLWQNHEVKQENFESNDKLENITKNQEIKDESSKKSTNSRLFYCCHCKKDYDNATHYCYIVDRIMRLRLSYPCQVCGEMVSSAQMSRHRKKHPEGNNGKPIFVIEKKISGKTFYCRFCDQSFDIGYHFCTARNKKIRVRTTYMCPYCGKNIPGGGYYNHIKRHNPDNKQKCEICGYIADSKRDFSSHMVSHDTGKIFPCNICGKCYKGPHSLSEHKYRVHDVLKPRKRFKNDSIYQCPECDFENYSSTLVSLHIVKEHKNSKSEKVRRYIYLYNKRKNGKVKDCLPEYESLKDIIKKKDVSSTDIVTYNNTENFDIGDHQATLSQVDYTELSTTGTFSTPTKKNNELDCKVTVVENQRVYPSESLVILSAKTGASDYAVVNFEEGTASVPNSCSESASLVESDCILYNTTGDTSNVIQYTGEYDDCHSFVQFTGTNDTVQEIPNDNQQSHRVVKLLHQNQIIPVKSLITSQQHNVQLVKSGNMIFSLAQNNDSNISYNISEDETIGETIEVVSEIQQEAANICDVTDSNDIIQHESRNMETIFIHTDT